MFNWPFDVQRSARKQVTPVLSKSHAYGKIYTILHEITFCSAKGVLLMSNSSVPRNLSCQAAGWPDCSSCSVAQNHPRNRAARAQNGFLAAPLFAENHRIHARLCSPTPVCCIQFFHSSLLCRGRLRCRIWKLNPHFSHGQPKPSG